LAPVLIAVDHGPNDFFIAILHQTRPRRPPF
jgi:hypothetical protein